MKRLATILGLLLATVACVAQDSGIIEFTTNQLTFWASPTNVYSGIQFRCDLRQTDDFPLWRETWHTFPAGWNEKTTELTNVVDLSVIDWDVFGYVSDTIFLRMVVSTNPLEFTRSPREVTVVNGSTSVVTSVDLVMEDAEGELIIPTQAPGVTNEPYVFQLVDSIAISGNHGDISGTYQHNGQSRNIFILPGSERTVIEINNESWTSRNK